MSEINPGDVVTVTTTPGFQTAAGVLTDPTTVTLRWRIGNVETVWTLAGGTVTRDSVGIFHANIPTTVAGVYYYRWEGTGTVAATAEGQFTVTTAYPATIPGAYADLSTFRQYLRNSGGSPNPISWDSNDPDTALAALALEGAARAIDRACGRDFRVASGSSETRYYTPIGTPWAYANADPYYLGYPNYVLPIDDIGNPTGITCAFDVNANGTYTMPITTFRVGPRNAVAKGFPYSQLIFDAGIWPPIYSYSVSVTNPAGFGWLATPPTVQLANLLQAKRFFQRRDAAFGIAGSPELGNQMRLLTQLDPDVYKMLELFMGVDAPVTAVG